MTYQLRVRVIEAKDIEKMDPAATDIFCELNVNSQFDRTTTCKVEKEKNKSTVKWNQDFRFSITSLSSQSFNIKMSYKKISFVQYDLATLNIQLDSLQIGQIIDNWYPMARCENVKENGQIHLSLRLTHRPILRASQDAKRAIKCFKNGEENCYAIYDIENPNDINQIGEIQKKSSCIIDCAFFPSAFGVIIALGYEQGKIEFIKENPDQTYITIDPQIGGPENEEGSDVDLEVPPFDKNLRVSLYPPELNIGYISNDLICIFYVDFQVNSIKLIPIRRYSAPNTLWFNFSNNYSIWRCTFVSNQNKGNSKLENQKRSRDESDILSEGETYLKLENYNLNSFEAKYSFDIYKKKTNGNEKEKISYTKNDFIDASISPLQFDSGEKVAVLTSDGTVSLCNSSNTNNNSRDHSYFKCNVDNPSYIEWSPLAARIAVFSDEGNPTIFINSSNDKWIEIIDPLK